MIPLKVVIFMIPAYFLLCVCMCVWVHAHTCVCLCVCVCVRVCVCVYVCANVSKIWYVSCVLGVGCVTVCYVH